MYKKQFGSKFSFVIYNSPYFNEIEKSKKEKNLKQKFNIKSYEKLFVYIGLLSEGRGIKKILNAFLNKK